MRNRAAFRHAPAGSVFRRRLLALSIGWATTVPAQAGISIPDVPLQVGGNVPPNILFLLDNSGSMEGTTFDDVNLEIVGGTSINGVTDTANINTTSYTGNTLYYNPAVTYRPWRNADGSYPADKSFTDAFSDTVLATGSVNLRSTDRTFHVPKNPSQVGKVSDYYRYRFRANSDDLERCERTFTTSWGWRNCTNVSSTTWTTALGETITRTLAQERTNFANWYSYHRTRAKAAKAGAGAAFSSLTGDVRVGFGTIHHVSNTAIPVSSDNGLFRGNNRTNWFASLYGQTTVSGTPLRSALQRAGAYYAQTSSSGPWGPESGTDQLTCRQNFTILTTDGYWNNGGTTYDNSAGNADGTGGTTITGPNGASYTYTPTRPYSDTYANTLADVAMQQWRTDLRADMVNNVPVTPADPAFWQHMVTFTISIGLRGSLNPKTDLPAITAGTKNWPDPNANEDATRIDDLWHAAVNGRGKFVVATEPETFVSGLRDALAAIVNRTSSSASVAANSTAIGSGTRVFQASFIPGQWTGDLKAYPMSSSGVSDNAAWSAAAMLPQPNSRTILTWNGSSGAGFPTSDQTATLTSAVANYLRGDRSNEAQNGGTLRDRQSLLGDIVHSSPAYVKDTDTVYVGANDGMLHAFNAANGTELFAYVPGGVDLNVLKSLSSPNYSHRFLVDGPVVVSNRVQTPNKNILVGALGRGGKGLFALDVTTPASMATDKVLWDKTGSAAPANMGLVLGRPIIGKLNNDVTALIVGNGPNSANERAVLFIYNLETGQLIKEIDTGIGSAASPNGLSAPSGWDNDGDGKIDLVYAGDLQGNLWRFNLSADQPNQWDSASNRVVMFAAGSSKPITAAPSIALHPQTFDTWVFFGTGRYLSNGDSTNSATQSLYGIKDSNSTVSATNLQRRTIVETATTNGRRVRSFEAASQLTTGKVGWVLDLLTPPSPGTAEGERVIGDVSVMGRMLIAASIIPDAAACGQGGRGYLNALDAFTGASPRRAFFDVDGDGSFSDDTVGSGNTPVGSVDLNVAMPTIPAAIGNRLVVGGSGRNSGSDGGADGGDDGAGLEDIGWDGELLNGRISWREIVRD